MGSGLLWLFQAFCVFLYIWQPVCRSLAAPESSSLLSELVERRHSRNPVWCFRWKWQHEAHTAADVRTVGVYLFCNCAFVVFIM